jgi:hemolysin III
MRTDKWSIIINLIGFIFFLFAIPLLLIEAWGVVASDRFLVSIPYMIVMIAFWPIQIAYHLELLKNKENETLQRVDRSSVFFLIAALFSPCMIAYTEEPLTTIVVFIMWFTAIIGTLLVMLIEKLSRKLAPLFSFIIGIIGIIGIILFIHTIPLPGVISFIVGTALFIGSGIIYVIKKPDLKPGIFGFHEVFHTLLLAATIVLHLFVSVAILG